MSKIKAIMSDYKHHETFCLSSKDLPEIKEWEVGKKYKIVLTVEQTGLNKRDYDDGRLTADFKILKAKEYEDE